ncbi:hypothetical protein NPA31_013300, partial [Aurantimonas sp. MSK8Z-1]|nr:hypothetical protein [Aurantimonas sp. MSK8Z-1]
MSNTSNPSALESKVYESLDLFDSAGALAGADVETSSIAEGSSDAPALDASDAARLATVTTVAADAASQEARGATSTSDVADGVGDVEAPGGESLQRERAASRPETGSEAGEVPLAGSALDASASVIARSGETLSATANAPTGLFETVGAVQETATATGRPADPPQEEPGSASFEEASIGPGSSDGEPSVADPLPDGEPGADPTPEAPPVLDLATEGVDATASVVAEEPDSASDQADDPVGDGEAGEGSGPIDASEPSDTDLVLDADLGLPLVGDLTADAEVGLDPVEALVGDIDLDLGADLDLAGATGDGVAPQSTGDLSAAADGVLDGVEATADAVADPAADLAGGLLDLGDGAGDPSNPSDTDLVLDADLGLPVLGDLTADAEVGLDPVEALVGDIDLDLGADLDLSGAT